MHLNVTIPSFIVSLGLVIATVPVAHAGSTCPDTTKGKDHHWYWDSVSEGGSVAQLNGIASDYVIGEIELYEDHLEKNLKWISEVRAEEYELVGVSYPTSIDDEGLADYVLLDSTSTVNCSGSPAATLLRLSSNVSSSVETNFSKHWSNTTSVTLSTDTTINSGAVQQNFGVSVTNAFTTGATTGSGTSTSEATTITRESSVEVPPNSGVIGFLYTKNIYDYQAMELAWQIPDTAGVDVRWRRKDNAPHICHHTYDELSSGPHPVDINTSLEGETTSVTVESDLMDAQDNLFLWTEMDSDQVALLCAGGPFVLADEDLDEGFEDFGAPLVADDFQELLDAGLLPIEMY